MKTFFLKTRPNAIVKKLFSRYGTTTTDEGQLCYKTKIYIIFSTGSFRRYLHQNVNIYLCYIDFIYEDYICKETVPRFLKVTV
jgi:hypothetical protein